MSYKQQILLGFVLLISFIEAIVISYDIHNAYQLRGDFLQQRSQLLTQTYAQVLRIPSWNLDQETTTSILQSIILDHGIIKVEIRYLDQSLPNQEVIASTSLNSTGIINNSFITYESITQPDTLNKIATLYIHFSKQHLEHFLSERLTDGLIEFLLLLAINFMFAALLINWITSPLLKISHAIGRLADHQLDVIIPETHRKDEIGSVARSVESFKQNSLELTELRISMQNKINNQTKDLILAKEKAEAASIAKSQFLATMSHELRTPLNGVLGMTEILKETPLNKTQYDSIETILRSGQDLMNIINDILDFSKLEADQLTLEHIPFNLKLQIEQLFTLLSPSFREKPLQFKFDYPQSTPDFFIGDPLRVKQILLNLLSNAIKFTHKGTITVSVHYQCDQNSSSILEIKVTDTGIGITDQQQQKLFESFTQADQATTRKYGGTGLGLTICKKLIEQMGGKINIDSIPNHGSTFTVKLNLPTGSKYFAKSLSLIENNDKVDIEPNNPILEHTILLVEDNLINQKIALIMLKKLGLTVDLAKDGEDALKQWNKHHYHFIYMDCLMPNMDGYQASIEIRKQQHHYNIQPIIVALTANSSQEDIERCKQSGMDDVVTKPFKKVDLINNINKWGKQIQSPI
ncbi:MAG: ATP-binding protein [Pseudomonadota bacterium]